MQNVYGITIRENKNDLFAMKKPAGAILLLLLLLF